MHEYRTRHQFSPLCTSSTARSRNDETRNGQRNANQNPEWWRDFSQQVKIGKVKFLGVSRYKFKLRIWLNLNSSVFRDKNSNSNFGLIWICSWLKCPHHSKFRFAFRWPFRVSYSRERAVGAVVPPNARKKQKKQYKYTYRLKTPHRGRGLQRLIRCLKLQVFLAKEPLIIGGTCPVKIRLWLYTTNNRRNMSCQGTCPFTEHVLSR